MNEFSMYEFAVSQKREGRWIVARIGLIFLYIATGVAMLGMALVTRLFAPLFAFTPILIWLLVFITWRYVSVEYEYTLTSGTLTFAKIYGGRSRRRIFELSLRDAKRIAPLDNEQEAARAAAHRAELVFTGVSSMAAPDIYFMLFDFEDKRGKKRPVIFYFEATAKALSICRFYNPAATVLSNVSR